jgi:hypothetical protein
VVDVDMTDGVLVDVDAMDRVVEVYAMDGWWM